MRSCNLNKVPNLEKEPKKRSRSYSYVAPMDSGYLVQKEESSFDVKGANVREEEILCCCSVGLGHHFSGARQALVGFLD